MELIKSPLNYTGGKFKLLGQLLPLFPSTEECDTFIDLFCGGCNVAANVEYSKVIANDSLSQLIGIYEHFKAFSPQDIDGLIEQHIAEYNLSKTNKEGYYKLKDKYNSTKDNSLLFTLICYAFNNQIRFNKSGEYNMPFGKDRSSYNKAIKERIPSFVSRVKNIEFRNESFEKIEPEGNCFIYCLPEGSAIYQDGEYKPIECVKELETDLGNGNICTKVHKRYTEDEDILEVCVMGVSRHQNLKLSKNHIVFVYENGEVVEKKASELTISDLLIIDYEKEVVDYFPEYTIFSKHSRKLLNIDYSKKETFAKILGLFMAQGHKQNGLHFSYDTKKVYSHTFTIEGLKQFFGITPSVRILNDAGSVTQIVLSSNEVMNYFLNFYNGKNAREKELSDFIMKWPINLQLQVLRGWLEGDGGMWSDLEVEQNPKFTRSSSRNRFKLTGTTTSHALACQFYNIALRCGLHPSIKTRITKYSFPERGTTFKDGRTESVCYDVYFTMKMDIEVILNKKIEGRNCGRRFHKNGYLVTRIKEINIIKYTGFMYDLTTTEGNFWCYGNVKVHNCDPPYLITTATYNESGGWTEKEEVKLLDYLDRCNSQGVKFALSNVLTHKGKVNSLLDNWAEKYNIHYLNKNYDSCSYHTKIEVGQKTTEILVTNY